MLSRREKDEFKEKTKKFLIGAFVTLATTLISKLVSMYFNSENFDVWLEYVSNNYSMPFSLFVASLTAGYFSQRK